MSLGTSGITATVYYTNQKTTLQESKQSTANYKSYQLVQSKIGLKIKKIGLEASSKQRVVEVGHRPLLRETTSQNTSARADIDNVLVAPSVRNNCSG